jgi:hypothetical protein
MLAALTQPLAQVRMGSCAQILVQSTGFKGVVVGRLGVYGLLLQGEAAVATARKEKRSVESCIADAYYWEMVEVGLL